jgi:hypothetical protein
MSEEQSPYDAEAKRPRRNFDPSKTRRAPHMEKYVVAKRQPTDSEPDRHIVRLEVDVQGFEIGNGAKYESKDHAEWMRDMLCIALDKIVKDQTGALRDENASLKARVDQEKKLHQQANAMRIQQMDRDEEEKTKLRSQVRMLREVLKPFVRISPTAIEGKDMPHYWVAIGSPDRSSFTDDDLRAARAAYEETEKPE